MKILRLLNSIVAIIEQWLIVISLGLMILFTFLIVIIRGIYGHTHMQWANLILEYINWSEPLVRLLVLWITFLGASLLTLDNRHIKIDIMTTLIPARFRPYRETILSILSALVCIFLVKASISYVKIEYEFGGIIFPGMPAWVGQMIIPLGFTIISIRFIITAIEQLLISINRGTK